MLAKNAFTCICSHNILPNKNCVSNQNHLLCVLNAKFISSFIIFSSRALYTPIQLNSITFRIIAIMFTFNIAKLSCALQTSDIMLKIDITNTYFKICIFYDDTYLLGSVKRIKLTRSIIGDRVV